MTTPAEKVLVTGASGYIAAHIINLLFSQGYEIVGTVRTASKGDWLADKFPGFKYEILSDLLDSQTMAEIFKKHADIKYVLHTATPMGASSDDIIKSLIEPAVKGTTYILQAAHEFGKNVEKVIVTSSQVAMYPEDGFDKPTLTVTEQDWAPVTMEQASSGAFQAYTASKKFAEKAVWDFQDQAKPSFKIATVLPPLVFGPPISQNTYSTLPSTVGIIKTFMELPQDATELPLQYPWVGHGDVRDVARAHIAAMQNKAADGTRLMPIAALANDQVVLNIIHKYRPKEAANMTKGTPKPFNVDDYYKYDISHTNNVLGFEYIPFEKTVLDHFDALVALKAKESK